MDANKIFPKEKNMKKIIAFVLVAVMLAITANAVIRNDGHTTDFWRDDKTNVKHSFDTVFVDGVSQMDLKWGVDGSAGKIVTDNPLTVGENVNSTIAFRGWVGINQDTYAGVTVAEVGYYFNENPSSYVKSGDLIAAEDAVVAAGGEYRFENLSINVAGRTAPTLITITVKGSDGNLYDFGEFSINGQYTEAPADEPEVTEAPVVTSPDQWINGSDPGENYTTGWWFHPVGEPDERFFTVNFTADGYFSGLHGFYFCSNTDNGASQATMSVQLIQNGSVLVEKDMVCNGDAWHDVDFGKSFPAGDYSIKLSCKAGSGVENDCWCVVGACAGNADVTIDTNINGPADATLLPCMMLIGGSSSGASSGTTTKPPKTADAAVVAVAAVAVLALAGVVVAKKVK